MRIGRTFLSGQPLNCLGESLCLHGIPDRRAFADAIEVVSEVRPPRKIDAEALRPSEAGETIGIGNRKRVAEKILVRRQMLVEKCEPVRETVDDRSPGFLIEALVEERAECLM